MLPSQVKDTASAVAYIEQRIADYLTEADRYAAMAESANREHRFTEADAFVAAARDALTDAGNLRARLNECRL